MIALSIGYQVFEVRYQVLEASAEVLICFIFITQK